MQADRVAWLTWQPGGVFDRQQVETLIGGRGVGAGRGERPPAVFVTVASRVNATNA
jgi:hypothetical protein